MERMQLLSEDVRDFYLKHGPFNQLVEVRSCVNIANKLGDNEEKGVFSLCPIPAGTHICPYVGEIYHKQPREGTFFMEVSKDVFVDAEHDPRDIGYLYFLDAGISSRYHSPPNYGRYINTIYPEDKEQLLVHGWWQWIEWRVGGSQSRYSCQCRIVSGLRPCIPCRGTGSQEET